MQTPVRKRAYVCAQCLGRWRGGRGRGYATSSSSSSNTLPPAPPPSGAVKLITRRLISLHGPDAPRFLQGIITNNVRPQSHSGFFAAFLTAQGKVLNDVFVYPTLGSQWHAESNKTEEPGYLVEVDADQATALLAHLKRHKLRAKLGLRLLDSDEMHVWSTWKAQDKWTPHQSQLADNTDQPTSDQSGGSISLVDTRAPGMGRRILLPASTSLSSHPIMSSLEEAPLSAYTIRRYLRGVAEGQAEIPRDGAFPMNVNLDLMDAIDFKKGCYVGQELTIRTHHTGVVRRRILPVALYDPNTAVPQVPRYDAGVHHPAPLPDTDISAVGKRGKPGKWVAGLGNIGLAMCRIEMMTDLVVTGEPVTFTPDSRFVIKIADEQGSEHELGVKAFVPDWIRGKVRTPKVQKRVE